GPATRGGEVPKLLRGHLVEELLGEGLRPGGGRRRAEGLVGECGGTQRAVTVAAVGARRAREGGGVGLAEARPGEASACRRAFWACWTRGFSRISWATDVSLWGVVQL